MPSPKVVVFDLGKVLVDFDYSIAARRIASRGKMSFENLAPFLSQSPLLYRFETGFLTNEQFYSEVCAATGFTGDLSEFCQTFADIFVPIESMVELNTTLRKRGIPTFIFSNTNDLAVGHIRRNFPFFNNFDGYILSYQHGAMKPDPKLYEVVESHTRRKGPEILYLDDRPENIATGAQRGWQVILQESPEKSRRAIQDLGLLG
jgi:FMN phosphatase YigB (HAD superfamily)